MGCGSYQERKKDLGGLSQSSIHDASGWSLKNRYRKTGISKTALAPEKPHISRAHTNGFLTDSSRSKTDEQSRGSFSEKTSVIVTMQILYSRSFFQHLLVCEPVAQLSALQATKQDDRGHQLGPMATPAAESCVKRWNNVGKNEREEKEESTDGQLEGAARQHLDTNQTPIPL
ncbi:hypothetical protein MG293_006638 [Ovis ammon polii]|uniref:Uncharacterized protein n=1 Tax=Ovis ammon polii TaxID=230172 RepID=A0AAD4UHG7_OVIAM|nr:hypothetical protein MG293_006638 [Ovis ammon polii]